ncbi:MAG: hypothetical protein CL910_04070 [Deltaproteobacteria bacterium]|nr:hypothetical protein [Deltaproteobacteria bacterium]
MPNLRWSSALALTLLTLLVLACPGSPMPPPAAGDVAYQRLAHVPVPGGTVNAAGGNGMFRRVDLSIDTHLGTWEIGAVWNSAERAWRWSFDLRFDGQHLVDGSGAQLDAAGLQSGQTIPGSGWVFVDAATLRTKGGWLHEFDAGGDVARIHWASSSYPSLEFVRQQVAGEARLVGIDQCTAPGSCSPVFLLQRDTEGRVVLITDRAGRSADFAYDAAGQLTTARDGLDTASGWAGFRYSYTGGQLASITNSEGERIEIDHDAEDRVKELRRIGPGTPTWRFSYLDSVPYTTELVDPMGALTRIRFDGLRRVLSWENGAGEVTTWSYAEATPRPERRTAPDGTELRWTWQDDDPATVTSPSGHVTEISYAQGAVDRTRPFERPIARVEDALGLIEERLYDGAGRLIQWRNGAGEATSFAYGANELLSQVTWPDGLVSGYSGHGEHGHPTVLSLPGGSATAVYDAVGNQEQGPDEESQADPQHGGITRRHFDEDRNLREVVLAEGPPASVVLRSLVVVNRSDGRRSSILRPYGGDSAYVYDGLGRLVGRQDKSDGVWRTTTFEYDALGRRTAHERANGMRREWSFDPAGRVTREAILRSGVLESEALTTWQDGRRISVHDSVLGGSETTTYDAYGRPEVVTYPGGEHLWLVYDGRSRVTAQVFGETASGFVRVLGTTYDAAGRVRTVSDGAQLLVDRQTVNGRVEQVEYGNGVIRSFGYGSSGVLASSTSRDGAGQLIEATTVDASCLVLRPLCATAVTDTYGTTAGRSIENFQLQPATATGVGSQTGARLDAVITNFSHGTWTEFDALSNPSMTWSSGACVANWQFGYDPERSRLQTAAQGSGATCPGHVYSHDEAGFVISRDGVTLDWDGAGRIRAIGADVFTWDGAGRPAARTIAGVDRTWRFGGRVEANTNGGLIAIDLGEVRIDLVSGARLYRHLDFRNNVKFVTDDSGRVRSHRAYQAYRGVEELGEAGVDDRSLAGGLELGGASGGLLLLGHRVLDPDVGRFLAPDPVFQLVNQYAYTLGNPVHYWDPDGRYQVTLSRALSIAALVVGAASLVVASPAVALGLGIASIGLGVAALVADAIQTPNPGGPGGGGGCGCLETPGPGPRPGPSPSPGPGSSPVPAAPPGGQIKQLDIRVDSAALTGGFSFDFALHLGGLIL